MTELEKIAINKAVDLTHQLINRMSKQNKKERDETWREMSEFEKKCMMITFHQNAITKK